MLENVGTFDRGIRIAVGLALVILATGLFPKYQTNWEWIGLIPLATGLLGTCPVYKLIGINTCST